MNSRRARPSTSLELQAHARHLSRFEPGDIAIAKALVETDFLPSRLPHAARLVQLKPAAFRQRLAGYVRRLREALGGAYSVGSGRIARELSSDQFDNVGFAAESQSGD